jgi:hypothetical protein
MLMPVHDISRASETDAAEYDLVLLFGAREGREAAVALYTAAFCEVIRFCYQGLIFLAEIFDVTGIGFPLA